MGAKWDPHKEWRDSGIDPLFEGVALEILGGDDAIEFALGHRLDEMRLNNPAQVSAEARRLLDRHSYLEDGGWLLRSVNPEDGEDTGWGCLKPRSPRYDADRDRWIKYEAPHGTPKQIICPPVPYGIGHRVALRHGLGDSYLSRIPEGVGSENEDKGFYRWAVANGIPLYICEGGKKVLSLLSHGVFAVGIDGCWGGTENLGPKEKPHHVLKPALKAMAVGVTQATLIPDQDGNPETRGTVRHGFRRLGKALAACGIDVAIVEWPQHLGKGIDDVCAGWGEKALDRILASAIPLALHRAGFTVPPSEVVSQRYLDLALGDEGVIVIKSPKGTGKTELLARNAEMWKRLGFQIVVVSHRRKLAQGIAERLAIGFEKLENGGIALCIDSLRKGSTISFNPTQYIGAIVIIDEARQVMDHLVRGQTEVRKNRIEIMGNLRYLLHNSRQVLALDADIDDETIALIGSAVEQVPHIILNTYTPKDGEKLLTSFEFQEAWLLELMRQIEQGKKCFVGTTSQNEGSRFSAQNLKRFIEKSMPEVKILVIDSETMNDSGHIAHTALGMLPDLMQHYDIVIVTPVIETGVDIGQVGLFDAVFMYANGVTPEASVRQFLARYRPTVPRYLYVAKTAVLGMSHKGAKSPDLVLAGMKERDRQNLIHSGIDGTLPYGDNEFLRYYCNRVATVNRENHNYRKIALERLTEVDGYSITHDSTGYESAVSERLGDVVDEARADRCGEVLGARDLAPPEAERLERQNVMPRKDKLALEKYSIRNRYGQEPTGEIVYADRYDDMYRKLRLRYRITVGYGFQKSLDQKAIEVHQTSGDGVGWLPDRVSIPWQCRANLLVFIGLPQFIESFTPDRVFTGDDDDVKAIFDTAHGKREEIKLHFGIKLASTPIGTLNQLLGLVGLGTRKKNPKSNSCKKYVPAPIPEFHHKAMAHWESQDIAKLEPAQPELEQVSIPEPQEPESIPFVQGVLNWVTFAVRWKRSLSPEVPQGARATVLRDGEQKKITT